MNVEPERKKLSELRNASFEAWRKFPYCIEAESNDLLAGIEFRANLSDQHLLLGCTILRVPILVEWDDKPEEVPRELKVQLYGSSIKPGLEVDYQGIPCVVVNLELKLGRLRDLTVIPEGSEFVSLALVEAKHIDLNQ
jgi:hypothetical protein